MSIFKCSNCGTTKSGDLNFIIRDEISEMICNRCGYKTTLYSDQSAGFLEDVPKSEGIEFHAHPNSSIRTKSGMQTLNKLQTQLREDGRYDDVDASFKSVVYGAKQQGGVVEDYILHKYDTREQSFDYSNANLTLKINHNICFPDTDIQDGTWFYIAKNSEGKTIGFLSFNNDVSIFFNNVTPHKEIVTKYLFEKDRPDVKKTYGIYNVCKITKIPQDNFNDMNTKYYKESEFVNINNKGVCDKLIKSFYNYLRNDLEEIDRPKYLFLLVRTNRKNINYPAIKCYLDNGFRFVHVTEKPPHIIYYNYEKTEPFGKYNVQWSNDTFKLYIDMFLAETCLNRLKTMREYDGENSIMVCESWKFFNETPEASYDVFDDDDI